MDSLKNLGATLSTHYEKIILSVILLALLGAAAYLPVRVSQNSETIRTALEAPARLPKKASEPVNTETIERVLRRARTEPELTLRGDHNVFNPVIWRRSPDGKLFKVARGDEDGPGGLQVTAIRPLEYRIEFDGVHRSGDRIRYKFVVLDEAGGGRSARARQVYLSEGSSSKNDPFSITRVNGPQENPESIQIRFTDSTETATLSAENPYKRIAGYEADMAHANLGQRFSNVRAKQTGGIRIGAHSYNVVAITKDEVTVESAAQKRWTVRLKGTL